MIYRTTHGTSPLSGRSICPKCKKTISWKYNIPLLSFFLLRGKCANCGTKISWQYPLVEALSGFLFVWWFLMGRSLFLLIESPWTYIQPLFWLIVGMILLAIFVADLRFGLIPDQLTMSLFILCLLYRIGLSTTGQMQAADFVRAIIVGLSLTAFFYFLWAVTKGNGFGFGDVKLAPSLGLLMGFPRTLVGIFLAFVVGAVLAVILLTLGKKKFGQTIPFGPFLVLGTAVALLWGNKLVAWYLGLL